MARLRAIIVTPERKLVDQSADGVVVPLFDGELGVLPLHAPLIGRLGAGELRILSDGKLRAFFVDGGFVEVLNDVVSVMTSRAQAVEELDVEAAAEALEATLAHKAVGDDMLLSREEAAAKARSLLRTARRAASRR
ncbi:MAG: ATP synthase F1 subunit epsilon [Thermogutta sp.]|nr:ATP synthase F1 subunit epsilon [Thermogutta sp.]